MAPPASATTLVEYLQDAWPAETKRRLELNPATAFPMLALTFVSPLTVPKKVFTELPADELMARSHASTSMGTLRSWASSRFARHA